MTVDDTLKSVFGLTRLRPAQEPVVDAMMAGRDVLAILPTGGGKSLCYQLPALLKDGVTVVISPLIALMRDQVRALTEAGVAAGALTSGNTEEETEAVFDALDAGRLKLLYMAPERLANPGTTLMLRKVGVACLAIDEAHCVSQWGHDFRPDYLRISALRDALGDIQIAAFTATADEETRQDIVKRLFPARPEIFLQGFDRPNINLAFAVKNSPRTQVLDFITARRGQSGIVYCATRKKTEVLSQAIRAAGLPSLAYHAGLEPEVRREAEARFQREDGLVAVATVAFGMGIDKPDIRYVLHADLPKSVESYYQEVGRAGRDGDPAEALTLYGPDDIRLRRSQIDEGLADDTRKSADHARLNALLGMAEAIACRRRILLGFFGETTEPCGNCDLCTSPPETFDATMPVRMALSAILRTDEQFGAGHVIDVLLGEETDKTRRWGHDSLPTFGVGTEYDRRQWQSILRQMMGRDLIRPDPERRGALRITMAAHPVLRGEGSIDLRKDLVQRATKSRPVRAMIAEEDEPVLAALKAKRRALAEAAKVPAYVIFADRTLNEMATKRPETLDQMMDITGIGAKKLAQYGAIFLSVLNENVEEVHPARRKLAGQASGSMVDRLGEIQRDLARGETGLDVYLSCNTSQLARIVRDKPNDKRALEAIVGTPKAERFGDAFLAALTEL